MPATETVTLDKLDAYLNGLAGWTFDFTRALNKCRLALVGATKENFDAGKAPDGTAWARLKFPRPNSKGADKPLRDNGVLAASLAARAAPGNVTNLTATSLEWGTNLSYAQLHQHGGTVLPKQAKYLSIPITKEAKRAGSPRNFPGLEYAWARGPKLRGKLVEEVDTEGKRKTKGGKRGDKQAVELTKLRGKETMRAAITHYLLVSQVDVPARPFLGWNDELAQECAEIMLDDGGESIINAPVDGAAHRVEV